MKTGWKLKKLGEIFEIERGGSPRPIDNYLTNDPDGINWIKIGDTKNVTKYITSTEEKIRKEGAKHSRMVYEGDFILSNSMSFGRPYIMKTTGCIHDGWLVLRQKELQVDQDYLYYILSSDIVFQQFNRLAAGSTVRNLNIGLVESVEISFPTLPEQHRIVRILDEAFAGIAVARANAEKNLQNAREVFESYLKEVFLQSGEGWIERRIGEVCKLKSGTTVNPTLEKTAGDLPYLKVADMTFPGNEGAIISSSRFLDKAEISENSIFPPGTTIFPKRGGAILTNKKRITSVSICADLNIMGVIPSNILIPEFLYYYFLNVDMRNLGSGSSIPQINNYDIEPLLITYPISTHLQEIIVNNLKKLLTETQHLEAIYGDKKKYLEELKQSLLHQAFSGEL